MTKLNQLKNTESVGYPVKTGKSVTKRGCSHACSLDPWMEILVLLGSSTTLLQTENYQMICHEI